MILITRYWRASVTGTFARAQTNIQDRARVSFARQTAPRLIWSFRAKTHDEASRGFGIREIGSRETGQLCVVRHHYYVSPRAVAHIQIFIFMCLWWSVWIFISGVTHGKFSRLFICKSKSDVAMSFRCYWAPLLAFSDDRLTIFTMYF